MKPRFFFWTLRRRSVQAVGLVTVILASACAPAAPVSAPDAALTAPTQTPETAAVPQSATEAPASTGSTPQAVATSRGPNLEATDPSTVNLASGGLQLVEFFRFT